MARRLKKKTEEHENHERWLVSYADFITLLFAFFVVMYATSSADAEKQKDFEESVRLNLKLGMMGSGTGTGKTDVPASDALLVELQKQLGVTDQAKKSGNGDFAEEAEKEIDQKNKAYQGVRHDSVGVRISLAASAFFPEGAAKLKPTSLKELNQVGALLKGTNRRVIVEGHTDDQQIANGDFASNWELASQRATTVVRYLIKSQSMDPKRFAAISYADQKPIVPNDSAENRAKNRRIEILIVDANKEVF